MSLKWRADIGDLGLNNFLYLESPTFFLKNGLKSSSLQSYTTFFHLIFKMIDKYQNLEGKKENELEIHLLEESLI